MDLKMLCDTADPLSLTFDLGNDCTSCSQDVHRVESLVFSNDGFKNAKQFCQTLLHQREKVLQIVCKRRRTSGWIKPSAHISQIQEQWITFWSTDWPVANVFLEFLLVSAVAPMLFCCVYMYGCPPRTGEVRCGGVRVTELVVAPCLSRTLLCFLLSLGVRAHRKRSAHDSRSFNASQTGADEERQNRHGVVHSGGTPCILQSTLGILITKARYILNETGTVCAHIVDFVLLLYLNFNNDSPFEGTPNQTPVCSWGLSPWLHWDKGLAQRTKVAIINRFFHKFHIVNWLNIKGHTVKTPFIPSTDKIYKGKNVQNAFR